MNALAEAFARLRAELAVNARLRAGAWAVAAILAVYGLLVQSDRVEAAHTIYMGDADRLDRARDLLTRADLPTLLEAERERGATLTERFWHAETQGLAQAQLQAALSEIVTDLEFRSPRIQSGAIIPVDYAPGLWRVQAQFNGIYEPGAELQVLHALATHPKKLVVDRLDLRSRDRRMTLLVSAWFAGIEDAEPTSRS
ncbi:MAG: hypothetical protein F4X36_16525 [Gammaproteobacteria bacterium]|nr:hypothetical protein [Gammaproteobacteria bacterium]